MAGFVVPLVIAAGIVAYGVGHGWWGADLHEVSIPAGFFVSAFSIVFSWGIVSGFLTHAMWRGIASVWLVRLAWALPAMLVGPILNWHRSGRLLLTVLVAQACGFLLGVYLAAKICSRRGNPRISEVSRMAT